MASRNGAFFFAEDGEVAPLHVDQSTFTPDAPDAEDIAKAIWQRQYDALSADAIHRDVKWRDRSLPLKFWESFFLDAQAVLALLYVKHRGYKSSIKSFRSKHSVSTKMSSPWHRLARRAKDPLIGILACAAVLLLVEATARVGSTIAYDVRTATSPEEGPAVFDYSSQLGWTIKHPFQGRPFKGRWETTGYRSYDSQGLLTNDAQELNSGEPRILFIGASNTFGYGVKTEQSFPEIVEHLLPTIATINVGVPGYSSYQTSLVAAARIPQLHPSLIVVDLGFNDRREARHEAEDGPESFQALYQSMHSPAADAARVLEKLATYRALRRLLRVVGLVPENPKTKMVSLATAKPRVDLQHFRSNLVAIAKTAEASSASVVFLLFPDSPHEIHTKEGIRRFEAGDYRSAAAVLEVAINDARYYNPLARLYLADAYRALGENDKADNVLLHEELPNIDGGLPIRPASTYNAVIREVAAHYGATVVDLEDVIKDRPYLISKAGHLTPEGHRVVAEDIVGVIRPMINRGFLNSHNSLNNHKMD